MPLFRVSDVVEQSACLPHNANMQPIQARPVERNKRRCCSPDEELLFRKAQPSVFFMIS